jgi:hypothetical protein
VWVLIQLAGDSVQARDFMTEPLQQLQHPGPDWWVYVFRKAYIAHRLQSPMTCI